jgi:hypothetical protein
MMRRYPNAWNCGNAGSEFGDVFARDCNETGTKASGFSGTTTRVLRWPMENIEVRSLPYVTGDGYVPDYGGVQERYWLVINNSPICCLV